MARKRNILIIKSGGTICQKENENGNLDVTGDQDYLHLTPEINNLANIIEEEIGPIDSTNMSLHHRRDLARIIKNNFKKYDGFVIIQGTDTMAASAISMNYMVQNLGKPIIFTGSQLPIYAPNTDAKENVINAVKTATENLGEVTIVFNKKIIRGSRAVKRHSTDFFGFFSPKAPLLGVIEEGIVKLNNQIPRRYSPGPEIFTDFKKNILYYTQISGADTNLLEKVINDIDCEGVVIAGYGTGNVANTYIKAIKMARKKGKPVAITTKCPYGETEKRYEVGTKALEAGAFLTGDMTGEAACHKMMYSLGLARSNGVRRKEVPEYVRGLMQNPIGRDIVIN